MLYSERRGSGFFTGSLHLGEFVPKHNMKMNKKIRVYIYRRRRCQRSALCMRLCDSFVAAVGDPGNFVIYRRCRPGAWARAGPLAITIRNNSNVVVTSNRTCHIDFIYSKFNDESLYEDLDLL